MDTHIVPVPVDFSDNDPYHLLAKVQNSFPDCVRDKEEGNIRLDHGSPPGNHEHLRRSSKVIP